ncbi:hypothetical protein J5N97_027615 [Dioscorea zingiberensis]|uniref:Polygalacturonase n=1 Tax=Dioscorea zingiberensis TaxID=325984 RepID=A0A9D5H409_9LILI|nr:hypothetical protein J5N97_027615 [Dioscorea zingiberensis]
MKKVFSPLISAVIVLLVLAQMGGYRADSSGIPLAFGPSWWEDMELWGEEEGLGGEAGTELDFMPTMWSSQRAARIPVNVDSFGAAGDGVMDDTQAFLSAWDKACSLKNAVFLVPEQRRYLVNATRFRGPCESNLIVQISGTIVAPDEPSDWDPKNSRVWLYFSKLKGVRIQGGGVIDGSGSKWWASSCKIKKTNPCRGSVAPTALTIDWSSGVRVQDLTIQSAQQIHFTIYRSDTIRISEVRVRSPPDSPNTDGIHISDSTNVAIQNVQIGTGGTSSSREAMKFACSDTVPCSNIVLNNINLGREDGTAETFCNCAMGFDYGFVKPAADCLRDDGKSRCGAGQDDDQKGTLHPIHHTEL